jgi:hypothetical protein
MTRIVPMKNCDAEWIRVSAADPCPICGADSNCEVFSDGNFASCNGRPSEWPLTNGAWLHRVEDDRESAAAEGSGTLLTTSLGVAS